MALINTNNGATFVGLTLKAWAHVSSAGTLLKSMNVTSITKGTAGIYTVNFTAAMATSTYMAKLQQTSPNGQAAGDVVGFGAKAVGSLVTKTWVAGGLSDSDHYVEVWE